MEPEIRCLAKPGITVQIAHTDEKAGLVKLSKRVAEDLLRHLVIDACDALPAGGVVSIATEHLAADAPRPTPEFPAGEFMVLTIRDSGTANGAIQPKMMQVSPLWKKGRALSLGACYQAVEFGGCVVVTRKDDGSAVSVFFPTPGERPEAGNGRRNAAPKDPDGAVK